MPASRENQAEGVIASIEPGSIAEELGWQVGDRMVSINGHALHDVIDVRFYSADEFLDIDIRRGDEVIEYQIEKDFDMPLGVSFEDILFDGVRLCGAHCIFCFVEQLPKGLRRSLYLKDDDYRLSFLHGNFVTLANVTGEDLDRIVTQRLSPLYVSVHTTDPALRERLLGRGAPDILAQIDRLAEGNITLHTQIVLCRGVNDGEHLDRTMEDLAARYPAVESIAVVPAGLSAHRRNATPIGSIDAQYSAEILNKVDHWKRAFLKEKGTRLVWAADEFHLSAGRSVPRASAYEGFPQIGNGIGLVRKFLDSAYRSLRLLPRRLRSPRTVSVVTGRLAAPLLEWWAETVSARRLNVNVYPLTNRLFGEMVTVAGLISGKDIIEDLRGRELGEAVFVPSVALRDEVFLDDVTVGEVEAALGCRVIVVEPLPYQLARGILEL